MTPPAPSRAGEFEEESKQPSMTEQQRHQLKHRELFLSRQFESLPATHIRCVWGGSGGGSLGCLGRGGPWCDTPALLHRGKCSVTLLNETDILGQYLEKEVNPTAPRVG